MFRRTLPLLIAALLLPALPARAQSDDPDAAAALVASFQKVEDAWSAAINNHDQFALENILSAQFVGISAQGNVTNRDQQVALLFNKEKAPALIDQHVASVRTFAGINGANIAVVNGTYALQTKSGRDLDDEQGIFTHIYLHTRTAWVCINAQRTVVVDKVLARTRLAPPKK